jgi:P27 family predicted phage terminase small subunit
VETHVAKGTWRKDRHGATVSLPIRSARPVCPEYLLRYRAEAKTVWGAVCDQLERDGVCLVGSGLPLELFVASYLEYQDALKLAKGQDCVVDSDLADGRVERKRNPIVVVLKQYRETLLQIATEIGLTPSGRARLLAHLQGGDKVTETGVAQRARE